MKHSNIKTSQQVEELSFVIAPPPHIKSDVSVLKDDVQFLTGELFDDRYSPAHISLFTFDDKRHFGDIVRQVEEKAVTFDPFNIFIKGLSYFGDEPNRTIYLDILNKSDVQDIFENLVKKNPRYMPFISIAEGLNDREFSKVWPHLQDFRYTQDFLCDRITVLVRNGNGWLHYRDIMFENI
jgi:2'-5' RNA ligase